MEAVVQLKRFGTVCPFLHRTPLQRLSGFSTSTNRLGTNQLVHLAQSRCPLMQPALQARGFATTTLRSTIGDNKKSNIGSTNLNSRNYASITEVQQEALRKATTVTENADASFVNPATKLNQVGKEGESHHEGRPTCALGFKKHIQHSPIFNYEGFYEAQLQKKHEDRSYRVSRIHTFFGSTLPLSIFEANPLRFRLQYFNNINRVSSRWSLELLENLS